MSAKRKGFIIRMRESLAFRGLSVMVMLSLFFELVQPTAALALTEGPSQPEVQSFEPIGTTQMVDLFSGDFNYNIPLFNLPGPNGGYPVNLAYHAGPTMDDEASWVGLGWNLNVGSLVRQLRGLPDEFKSVLTVDDDEVANGGYDYLEVKSDMRENWTLGASIAGSFKIAGGDLGAAINTSMSVYYNSFTGIGTSIGVGFASTIGHECSPFSLGGSMSLDSENGLGLTATAGLSKESNCEKAKVSTSLTFDGELSVAYSLNTEGTKSSEKLKTDYDATAGFGSSATFARNGFTPANNNRFTSFAINFSVKGGIEAVMTEAYGSIGLFYRQQTMSKQDKNGRKIPVVGYASSGLSGTTGDTYSRDFTRANDGQITKSTMFLPYSYYNYDTYVSTGQGLSGYFRPRRADIGRSFDPKHRNDRFGVNVGLDLAAGQVAHVGVDLGLNYGYSSQGPWNENNNVQLEFENPAGYTFDEVVYYQAHGEMTILDAYELDHIGGEGLATLKLLPRASDGVAAQRKIDDNVSYESKRVPTERAVRNTLIHTLTNDEVNVGNGLGEFKVDYYSDYSLSGTATLNRAARDGVSISSHPAGYKVLNEDGNYYVYGLPAYNVKSVENTFSVSAATSPGTVDYVDVLQSGSEVAYEQSGTHKYIQKVTTSPYAHSYMLTSVLGADYVDIENDGPTDDDLGYWVKFKYVRHASEYKWRAPFTKAQYTPGQLYDTEDDKGTYSYGTKELWYVGQMETKTHVAVFHMSPRADGYEAASEFANSGMGSAQLLKLDSIEVFEKTSYADNPSTAVPLQTVHFDYGYSLCSATPNSQATPVAGKLTLKSIWFTSNGSSRGELSKYSFDYNTGADGNPAYSPNAYDMWGGYKKTNGAKEHHRHFPYVNQFNQDWGSSDIWEPSYGTDEINETTRELTRSTQAEFAGAWSLKRIHLPSGGTIEVEYESDDYGYVQHKTATQMFKIEGMKTPGSSKVYDSNSGSNDFYDPSSFNDEENRRIYFKLEQPISTSASAPQEIWNRYLNPMIRDENGDINLYFKAKMKLNNSIGSSSLYDYVSGYLPVEKTVSSNYMGASDAVGGYYTKGYVTVKAAKKKDGNEFDQYHPMALAAWVYMQTNAQKLLSDPTGLENGSGFANDAYQVLTAIPTLMGSIPTSLSKFGAIRAYCKSSRIAQYIDLDYSVIRLASPDKIKYGGGHRVKKITITDNWNDDTGGESNQVYGQVFDYTIEENGSLISSGVAQYEPQAGGDENALKYPFYYFDKQNVFTKNQLFAEAPINEALFPAASVGYRKVTVRSLNTSTRMQEKIDLSDPVGRTGGITVHEFYTAKEFPTRFEHSLLAEENDTKEAWGMTVPVPLIGSYHRDMYHGIQAYKIELNDMHGKPRSVKTYELSDYEQNINPITSVIYEYQCKPIVYQDEHVFALDNVVQTIENDGSFALSSGKLMGVEYDLFTDQREARSRDFSLGGAFNLDIPATLPVPSFWINSSYTESLFRTYVTNKVIHKSGILKRTIARDLQTVNESEVIAYDEKSGHPVLVSMTNEFGDKFYQYDIPAYYHYDRMGHAYQNINFVFTEDITREYGSAANDPDIFTFSAPSSEIAQTLVRGDELLFTNGGLRKGYFLGWERTQGGVLKGIIHFPGADLAYSSYTSAQFKVIRSGRRNLNTAVASSYLTKGKMEDLFAASNIQIDPSDATITARLLEDGVLSAASNVYSDSWPNVTVYKGEHIEGAGRTQNPFLAGINGVWQHVRSYSYIGARSGMEIDNTSGILSAPDLSEDGVMTNVPMYSYELGDIESYDETSRWEWVTKKTRYVKSLERENKNRLGIYSSALFGYNNDLVIAVGGNASINELGAFDFEMDNLYSLSNMLEQTNMAFRTTGTSESSVLTEQFSITSAVSVSGNNLVVTTNMPYAYYSSLSSFLSTKVALSLVSRKTAYGPTNEGYYYIGNITGAPSNVNGYAQFTMTPFIADENEADNQLPAGGIYHGDITFLIVKSTGVGQSGCTYTDEKAHSGKKSLEVTAPAVFDQPGLRLINGKKYALSMWVSRDNERVLSYQIPGLVQVGTTASGFTAVTPDRITYGKIVEGWQKIDVEFSISENYPVFAIRIDPGSSTLYVDDIRFSPKTGGITTNVYDPVKKWLRATLNVDNYATFYYYDEEGHLTLKKQETEEGIFTITESRGHVSEQ